MISDYASLLVDAGNYAGNDAFGHVAPLLTGLAETKLNRVLRVGDMEDEATITLVNGEGTLPTDFLEARQVTRPDGKPINATSIQRLQEIYGSNSGNSYAYCVVGNVIKAFPSSSQDLIVRYYAKIPGLTISNPTNWLLTLAPDVYLYAIVAEISIWSKDAAGAQAATSLRNDAIQGLKISDERARWGNGQVVVGGYCP